MAKNVLTEQLSEPLNGATTARVDINAGDGNLTTGRLTGDGQVLASGTLQYFENQGLPTRTLVSSNGQATLTLRGRYQTTLVPFPLDGLQRSNRVADPPQSRRLV